MNLETIRRKTLENQAWLERAILVLDRRVAWDEDDVKAGTGTYIANWIRSRLDKNVELGKCINTDYWLGRARYIVQKYIPKLLEISLERAERLAAFHADKAEFFCTRVEELRIEVEKLKPAPIAPITSIVPVTTAKKPRSRSKKKASTK